MSRTVVGLGAHGAIVRLVQQALCDNQLLNNSDVDGWFGANSANAVSEFQRRQQLAVSGSVDLETWAALLPKTEVPSLPERCLALTAAFEGHDYTLAVGNFDGAWLTWGIIGFTLKHGELSKILLTIAEEHPELIQRAFGAHADEIVSVMKSARSKQEAWADSVTVNRGLLAEPWRTAFKILGGFESVQRLQQQIALGDYFEPAKRTAVQYGLATELGVALCFDIHVQNGGISARAGEAIKRSLRSTELDLRRAIAKAVASTARAVYRVDVLARKMTIAEAQGRVHGANYVLENWGLSEIAAEKQALAARAGK
jgi:hypothetical protein